jgi:hypothetical protein
MRIEEGKGDVKDERRLARHKGHTRGILTDAGLRNGISREDLLQML